MLSTDGKRLTKTDYFYLDQKFGLPPGESIIIPKKGLNEVGKFLETEGLVQVGMQNNNFIVKKENETIIISLLEGEFPSFDDIISVGEDIIIELDKESFKMMLRRMSILTSDDYKGVYFIFNDDKLVIKTANPDIGESKEEMIIQYKEQPIEVAFNPQFFIDALNFIESDTVYLNIRDEEHPCLIQGE
ncbi:MAG: DNA polymerase III subunit beta, partial [archaeon]|nr:DNA polymerase III subunit beta [archaeon]